MVGVEPAVDGRNVVRLALRGLTSVAPQFAAEFKVYKDYRYANAGGSLDWGLSSQRSAVSNPADETGTPLYRVSAQLTVERADSRTILEALRADRQSIEAAMGHRVSWLPGGDTGDSKRSSIRSWRALDASEEALATWLWTELLRLRGALRPHLERLGLDIP